MWCLTRRSFHRRFPFPHQSARRPLPLRRGPLVAELDRPREELNRASPVTSLTTTATATTAHAPVAAGKGPERPTAASAFLSPSRFVRAPSAPGERMAPSAPGAARDELSAQEAALREMFDGARRRCVRLRKDPAWLKEERRAFRQAHGRGPSPAEVQPHVDVALAPTAALKLAKHLSLKSSARDAVVRSILLQQSVARSQLVQSNAQTLFRCLRCFHVYAARPRTLLRESVGHSWLEYEAERKRNAEALEIARRPGVRKAKCSVGRRRAALAEDPHSCPKCGSTRAQWMMEYAHYNAHG